MPRFRFLEHTADIKLKIYGASKKELFENGCFAIASIQREDLEEILARDSEGTKREVKVGAAELELLLVKFLQEVVYLADSNNEVYPKIKIKKLTDNNLMGELEGIPVEGFFEDIKAVTYNDLEVKKTNAGWEAVVVLDV